MRVFVLSVAVLSLTSTLSAGQIVRAEEPRPVANGRVLTLGPLEADFAKVEAKVPGFAGWYFDANGNAVVVLKDVGRKEEAFAQIASFVEARRDQRGPRIAANAAVHYEARPARYSFLELAAFRDAVQRRFREGIVRIDVDEVRNVLALGVAETADLGRIRAHVARLGIPANAVTIEVAGEASPRAHLFQYHRPLRGGSQLMFRLRDNSLAACTLGVNGVYYSSSDYAGFITASHCTQYPWSYSGNNVYQGSMADLVATEYDDPSYFDNSWDGNCPVDTPLSGGWSNVVGCRWSDTAFYRYTDTARSTAWGGATIHTVAWSNSSMAYTDITGSLPVNADAYSAAGTYVHKIGATTGETDGYIASHPDGTVSGTCVNRLARSNTADPFVLLLCQDASDLAIDSGDSGGPVYRKYETYVDWVGILWGNDSNYTYHSPAWAVRTDLPSFSY